MQIKEILRKMTLEEKIAFCSGANFWQTKEHPAYKIPSVNLNDGPHGLRKQDMKGKLDMLGVNKSIPATCFPTASITAASWDPELLSQIGEAIAEEAVAQKVGVVLGPGVNMKRDPLCGRNFEYFSEDPFLAGKLAAAYIRGVQSRGVGTSLKHFAANNQELSRFHSDSVMDERTLRELYLTAFEIAVKEGKPATVMSAYNKINGVHCSDSRELLTDILRTQWGFDGMVVTDWGGMNDRIEGFRAGCDLSMPGGSDYMEKECLAAVKNGTLSEAEIDTCVERILRLVFSTAQALEGNHRFDVDAHHALAERAACESTVLLKNEGILPLRQEQNVVLVGYMAKEMRYQGAGSSHINPTKRTNPMDAMPECKFVPGCDERGDTTDALLAEAAEAARQAQVAVVFAGLPDRYESEGFDRDDMCMPEGHIRMIDAVSNANPNTVVVLLCGSPVECPWADKVRGILYMGLSGQAGGGAAAKLLYGAVNPSGKLAESWPYTYSDCVTSPYYGKEKDALYREGLYTGYRYYDKAGKAVRWPFGYGLSYTRFLYSDLKADETSVTVTVTNVGATPGAEVVQMFVAPPAGGIHRPIRELKGFTKVFLQPGESKTVKMECSDRSFAVWHNGWKIQKGEYTIQVGDLQTTVFHDGEDIPVPEWQTDCWYATCQGVPTQKLLETAMGRKYTPPMLKKGNFTMDNTVMEMKDHSLVMKIMYSAVETVIAKGFGGKKDYENPEFRMMINSSVGGPLRGMQISGGIKGGIMPGLLEMANGHFFQGIWKMIKG